MAAYAPILTCYTGSPFHLQSILIVRICPRRRMKKLSLQGGQARQAMSLGIHPLGERKSKMVMLRPMVLASIRG